MPGIAGLLTNMPRDRAQRELLQMLEAVRHEPSYASGTWADEALGLYVGWTARKASFSEAMPLHNENGDVFLVFSGEEFPGPEVPRRLKANGHAVEDDCASYLTHLYEDDPSAFPASLNGWFHGLVADQIRGLAILFNDRYGLHRVYFHQSKDAFYFAAEAKAILAVRPELRRADSRGMGEFVACGCVLENRTLFENIYVLPPASAWLFRNGIVERKRAYFHPREWEDQAPLQPEACYQELRNIFSQNLSRYFTGPGRVGMSLTGGLDTRMIMAWQKCPPGSLRCYSFGSIFRDCQDVVQARRVARACNQPYEVIPVAEGFLSRFSHYAERSVYLTDGCIDVRHSADLYANERAAEIAPIRMTGNYGGEVLRRVRPFKPVQPSPGLFVPDFLRHIDVAKSTYAESVHGHPLSFAVFRQAPWHHYGLLSLEQTQVSLRSPFLDNEFVRTLFRAHETVCTNNDMSIRLIADGNPNLARIRTDRGLMMRPNGLWARTVRGLLEFSVKTEYANDYGMPQWAARIDHFLSPFHLERLFLGRHKFYHFRVWYRDTLSQYVREMLLDSRTLSRPYLQRRMVQGLVRDHIAGVRNYTREIHNVLTLEIIARKFLDPD